MSEIAATRFILPSNENRPEELRVIKRQGYFWVETNDGRGWRARKYYNDEDSAVRVAMSWYPDSTNTPSCG